MSLDWMTSLWNFEDALTGEIFSWNRSINEAKRLCQVRDRQEESLQQMRVSNSTHLLLFYGTRSLFFTLQQHLRTRWAHMCRAASPHTTRHVTLLPCRHPDVVSGIRWTRSRMAVTGNAAVNGKQMNGVHCAVSRSLVHAEETIRMKIS